MDIVTSLISKNKSLRFSPHSHYHQSLCLPLCIFLLTLWKYHAVNICMFTTLYFLSPSRKNSDVISLYRTHSFTKFTMVCQPAFFLPPLPTQFFHEKQLRLPFHVFFTLSNFLTVFFLGAFLMTPVCKFSKRRHVARFNAYNILTRDIKRLTWGLIALQVCCPGILVYLISLAAVL